MNKMIICLIVGVISTAGFTQKIDERFRKISNIDFEIQGEHEKSDALILLRKVDISFFAKNNALNQKKEVTERIRIETEAGLEYATKRIRLYNSNKRSREKIKIKGYTYNQENGEIEDYKLKNASTFTEELNDKWRMESFTMPQVKIGSVIEYTYEIISPFLVVDDVPLQYSDEILKETITFSSRKYTQYNIYFNPLATYVPDFDKEFKRVEIDRIDRSGVARFQPYRTTLEVENVPGLKPEPMISGLSNYRAVMSFELAASSFGNNYKSYSLTWNSVATDIMKNDDFGAQLSDDKFLDHTIETITQNDTDSLVSLNSIYTHLKEKVKWNGYYGKFTQNGIKEAYKSGSGNVADVNLLLVTMLRKAGFKANPVLISSRKNGIPLFPTQDGFNYVVAHVALNDKSVILDATEEWADVDELPTRAINWYGRLVLEDGTSQEVVLPNKPAQELISLSGSLDSDLSSFNAHVNLRNTNAMALLMRDALANKTPEKQIEYLGRNKENSDLENLEIKDLKDVSKPLTISYDIKVKSMVEAIGDKIYLSPLMTEANTENPFQLEERKLPLDFNYPIKSTAVVNIQIPDGYEVSYLPESQKLMFGDNVASYTYLIKVIGNTLTTQANFVMVNKDVTVEEYPFWREFFMNIIKKDAEKVILKKIEE